MFFMFFWLEPKESKVQGKHHRSAGFARPTHKDSDHLKVVFLDETESRRPYFVLCDTSGGAAFSLAVLL